MITNWLDLPIHPTDEYVHWNDTRPKDKMIILRVAYDKLVELGCKEEVTILLEAAYAMGGMDEHDAHDIDL
jgi:hypothetical protein